MRGALKVTYNDGSYDYFEVDPVGSDPGFAKELEAFLESPDVVLVLENEVLVIPSTSIRHLSITRADAALDEEALDSIPGVLLGVKRIIG
jgi:hypothetical protein